MKARVPLCRNVDLGVRQLCRLIAASGLEGMLAPDTVHSVVLDVIGERQGADAARHLYISTDGELYVREGCDLGLGDLALAALFVRSLDVPSLLALYRHRYYGGEEDRA